MKRGILLENLVKSPILVYNAYRIINVKTINLDVITIFLLQTKKVRSKHFNNFTLLL